MTSLEAKNYIGKLTSHITFEYDRKDCGVDPLSHNECRYHLTVGRVIKIKRQQFEKFVNQVE